MTIPHIGPERLTAYLDHVLEARERDQVISHFAECADCRREMTVVRRLLKAQVSRRRLRLLTPLVVAAAAGIVLISIPASVRRDGSRAVATRSAGGPGPIEPPQFLAAWSPGATVEPDEKSPTFAWQSAGPDATYRLTVQDSAGGIVWSTTTEDTTAVFPSPVQLATGQYFWSVAARLPSARSARTMVQRVLVR